MANAPETADSPPPPASDRPGPKPTKTPRKRRRFFGLRLEPNLGTFFAGFILALVPGVAGTLWAISYLADNVSQLVNIALLAILFTSFFGTLLIALQGRLFRWLGFTVRARLADVAQPVYDAVVTAVDGDPLAAGDHIRVAAERAASWYSWFSVRRWVIGITVALLAGFAALIGSALIHEQNRLIEKQNEYFQRQNAKLEAQLSLAEGDSRALRRTQLIATLYDGERCDTPPCPLRASLRSRAEAFRALLVLDQAEQGWGADHVAHDYSGIDLRWADLDDVDLRGARLRGADLRGASLRGADLRGADLSNARLSTAELQGADLGGARLASTELRKAVLRGASVDPQDLALAITDDTTVAPSAPAAEAVACAMCCAGFETGRSAARVYGSGAPSGAERQDLIDELYLLGLSIDAPERAGAGLDGHATLFTLDRQGEDLWAQTRHLVAAVQLTPREQRRPWQLRGRRRSRPRLRHRVASGAPRAHALADTRPRRPGAPPRDAPCRRRDPRRSPAPPPVTTSRRAARRRSPRGPQRRRTPPRARGPRSRTRARSGARRAAPPAPREG